MAPPGEVGNGAGDVGIGELAVCDVDRQQHIDVHDRAQAAVADQAIDGEELIVEAQVLRLHHDPVVGRRQREELTQRRRVRRDRLLAEDVASGIERLGHEGNVAERRCEHVHDLRAHHLEHLPVIRVGGPGSVARSRVVGDRRRQVADGHEIDISTGREE